MLGPARTFSRCTSSKTTAGGNKPVALHRNRVTSKAAATGDASSEQQAPSSAFLVGSNIQVMSADTNIGLELLKASSGISELIALLNYVKIAPAEDLVVVVYNPRVESPKPEGLAVTVRRRWLQDLASAAAMEEFLLECFDLKPGQACVRGLYKVDGKTHSQQIRDGAKYVFEAVKKVEYFEVYHPF